MKLNFILALAATAVMAGCATTNSVPAGLEAGKFVSFDCEGQDFSARFNPEGNTVRVRTHHGATELSPAGEGVYQGDGFKLSMKSATGITIEHAGKVLGKNCKRA
jgi:outer membrane biogenesis lipoprotein LolB